MKESVGLKVYSYAKPHCKLFREEQFGTVGQFQNAVEEWFGIAVSDQKLVMDGRVMEEKWLTAPFKELKIKENSHLIALTKTPYFIKKKRIATKPTDATLDKSIASIDVKGQQVATIQRGSLVCDPNSPKVLSCLKDAATDALITHFIKALRIPRAELLLLNEPKLLFILEKVTENTPNLREMLHNKIDTVKLALIDQTKLQQSKQIPSTTSIEAENYLISLNYTREHAVRALEVCRNDLYAALSLLGRDRALQSIEFQAKRESVTSEFISISQWLGRTANKPLLRYLRHKPEGLPIFMSFWKHVCPELFELTLRWYSYLPTLLQHHGRTDSP